MIRASLSGAETLRDEKTGVTYEPAIFDLGVGYVVTHPDGRQECLILSPSLWHSPNRRGSQGDTFIYHMTAPQAKAWDENQTSPDNLGYWDFTDKPVAYVNHFENAEEAQ